MPARRRRATALLIPWERIFEALEFGANIGGALGDGHEKDKEDGPSDEVRRKDAIEIFH
jgi:hypothetical protein